MLAAVNAVAPCQGSDRPKEAFASCWAEPARAAVIGVRADLAEGLVVLNQNRRVGAGSAVAAALFAVIILIVSAFS